jgi:glycerate kinase
MRIVVAPDSFKGSLKSPQAARAMADGVRDALPDADVRELPVGDGGEGTLEALVAATGGEFRPLTVTGPLGQPTLARLGLLGDGETAFVEMAEASGLSLAPPDRRDPLAATTFGTGEMIDGALASGRPRVLIGIGGSATTDGGVGALSALGARFLDRNGRDLPPGGGSLASLERIEAAGLRSRQGARIIVACDVTNPLTGPCGAAAVYGPQKGAGPAEIAQLDAGLARLADVAAAGLGRDLRDEPGAGAAGGLGFALMAFLGAEMRRGAPLVLEAVRFDDALQGADLVLTGEGSLDAQTLSFGKTVACVADRARARGVPVLALAGSLGDDLGDFRAAGIASVASIVPRPMPLEEAMARAAELLRWAAARLMWVYLAGRGG